MSIFLRKMRFSKDFPYKTNGKMLKIFRPAAGSSIFIMHPLHSAPPKIAILYGAPWQGALCAHSAPFTLGSIPEYISERLISLFDRS